MYIRRTFYYTLPSLFVTACLTDETNAIIIAYFTGDNTVNNYFIINKNHSFITHHIIKPDNTE